MPLDAVAVALAVKLFAPHSPPDCQGAKWLATSRKTSLFAQIYDIPNVSIIDVHDAAFLYLPAKAN